MSLKCKEPIATDQDRDCSDLGCDKVTGARRHRRLDSEVKDPACFGLCARGLNFSKYKQAGYRVRVLGFQSQGPGMNFSARADTTFNLKDPARTSSLSAHSCRVLHFGTRRSNPRTRHVFTFSAQWLFPPFPLFSPFLFPFPFR